MRDGLRAEAAFHERRIARRPAIPRKLFAATLAGEGVALAAYRNDENMIASIILAVITVALHLTCFGLDPMKDKRMEGIASGYIISTRLYPMLRSNISYCPCGWPPTSTVAKHFVLS